MEAGPLRFTEKLKAAVSELQLFGKEAVDFWKIREKKSSLLCTLNLLVSGA